MAQALAEKIDRAKSDRYIDSSLQSLQDEIAEIQQALAKALDSNWDDLDTAPPFEAAAAGKIASKLDEIAGALTMLNMAEPAKLVVHLKLAVLKLGDNPALADVKQRQAVFEAGYFLSLYIDFVRSLRANAGDEMPLILSPFFYKLASAGLAPFVDESEIAGIAINFRLAPERTGLFDEAPAAPATPCPPDYNPEHKKNLNQREAIANNQATYRRLRKMYQVALIGLLRGSSSNEQLTLVDHVASRSAELIDEPLLQAAWASISMLVTQFTQGNLELTPQRKHFFARFDRWLREMSKGEFIEFHDPENSNAIRELATLLILAGHQEYAQSKFHDFFNIDVVKWTDEQIVAQRRSVESGLRESLMAMSESISELLDGLKQRLSVMSESELCEQSDVSYLTSTMHAIAAVLKFCNFTKPALVLESAAEQVKSWTVEMPTEQVLLQVANSILSIENALLCYSMNNAVGQNEHDASLSLEDGMIAQAHQNLFKEMQANISLSIRALNSYVESEYDREHIANVGSSLIGAIGGFQMVGLVDAANLAEKCAARISEEYDSEEGGDTARLEKIADCLVSIEYVLHELAAGGKLDGSMQQLIAENMASL